MMMRRKRGERKKKEDFLKEEKALSNLISQKTVKLNASAQQTRLDLTADKGPQHG
ncbi:hypothetical protein ACLEIY_14735 [Acetobacter tropicalis]|uniref:hypothetical protein n=1 Tax=Acetobacter TaxID=434 RepID=UPI001EDBD8FD|nr:hypothetical protein [Acetobacter senegalensis]MCG4260830.1 hypothetical protein [Acetobacter senegalensis]